MKHPHTRFVNLLTIGAIAAAGLSTTSAQTVDGQRQPVVITPPATRDGSNFSRAPYPAARQFDDTQAPNGEAIDASLPPNTPASNQEPPVPPARIAILQTNSTAPYAVASVSTEPVLTPTGRATVYATTPATETTIVQTYAKPVVITPPAVNNGSNFSRAPFPASRRFDDTQAPNGEAIDSSLPPNTPATNNEPAVPAARIAIMQPVVPVTTAVAVQTVSTEPTLVPTGRTSAEMQADAQRAQIPSSERVTPPAVRDGSNASRAPLPAARQFDDVKAPDGQAVDPNTPPPPR